MRSFKFLGVLVSEALSWLVNTTAPVNRVQRLQLLRVLRRNNTKRNLLMAFDNTAPERGEQAALLQTKQTNQNKQTKKKGTANTVG